MALNLFWSGMQDLWQTMRIGEFGSKVHKFHFHYLTYIHNIGGTDADYRDNALRIEDRDASLWDRGLKECESAKPVADLINIHTVFISPMKRALQTAYNIFGDRSEIKFVIIPKAKEALKWVSDVPVNMQYLIDEFSMKFPNLDTSLFDAYDNMLNYFYEDLDEEIKSKIQDKIEPKEDDPIGNNIWDLIVDQIAVTFPDRIESHQNILNRANWVKDFVKKYQVPQDQKIVLLAHFSFLQFFTGEWDYIPEDGIVRSNPDRFVELMNCKMAGYDI